MPVKLESPVASAPPRPIRILALGDSPVIGSQKFVLSTGFGRVNRNVFERWTQLAKMENGALKVAAKPDLFSALYGWAKSEPLVTNFDHKIEAPAWLFEVHCWAINFDGWGYQDSPVTLFPAAPRGTRWNSPENLQRFLQHLVDGEYTHVYMLMDPDALSVHGFPAAFKKVCREHNIRSLLYYPVDSTPERDWLAILDAVDVAVTYTEFGRVQTRAALGKSLYPIEVVPHGVDAVFRPLPVEERAQYRKLVIEREGKEIDFIQPGDFFMLNVNKNEWRKDPLRSLEILKGLRDEGVPAKLVMRMAPASAMGGIYLETAARQLGLTYGVEWVHIDSVPDENLCGLYNAADLYLTTSMGEGWGLGVTEAMACHCPVAMARHTSLAEIGNEHTLWLPLEEGFVCGADTRLRQRVDLDRAVSEIFCWYNDRVTGDAILRVAPGTDSLKNWSFVADRLLKLLIGGAK